MIISAIAISVIMTYFLLIGLLIYGFDKIENFKLQDLPAKTTFLIIIPFWNQAEHLTQELVSISKLNYPKSLFKIILVHDKSDDDSISIIEKTLETLRKKLNSIINNINVIKNIRTSNSPKKDAISSVITVSKFDWIITTDTDCALPKYSLDTFDEFIQIKNLNCIVAPVTYYAATSFFNRYHILDVLNL